MLQQPPYPKQVITVLPGTEGTASQYPIGPGIGAPQRPPAMGEIVPPVQAPRNP